MKKRMILWILVFLNLATIFFFSHQTGEQSGALSDGLSHQLEIRTPHYEEKNQGEKNVMHANLQKFLRRFAHVMLFTVLGVLIALLVAAYPFRWYRVLCGMMFGILYALLDEVHQLFIPGRTFQIGDIISDVQGFFLGMTVTAGILFLIRCIRKKAILIVQQKNL